MRKDRREHIAIVMNEIGENQYKTASEIAKNTQLSVSTVSDILHFLHNNFIGFRFKSYKKVRARIFGYPVNLTVLTKPLEWNDNLLNKIYDFIENPTLENFVSLKRRALRVFSRVKENWSKLCGGIKEKTRFWIRNTDKRILNYFLEWSPPPTDF